MVSCGMVWDGMVAPVTSQSPSPHNGLPQPRTAAPKPAKGKRPPISSPHSPNWRICPHGRPPPLPPCVTKSACSHSPAATSPHRHHNGLFKSCASKVVQADCCGFPLRAMPWQPQTAALGHSLDCPPPPFAHSPNPIVARVQQPPTPCVTRGVDLDKVQGDATQLVAPQFPLQLLVTCLGSAIAVQERCCVHSVMNNAGEQNLI